MMRSSSSTLFCGTLLTIATSMCACSSTIPSNPAIGNPTPPAGVSIIRDPSIFSDDYNLIKVRRFLGVEDNFLLIEGQYNRELDPEVPFLQDSIDCSSVIVIIAPKYLQIDGTFYDLRCVVSKSSGLIYVASSYPKPNRELVWPPAKSSEAAASISDVDAETWLAFASDSSVRSLHEVLGSLSILDQQGTATGFTELVVSCVQASGGGVGLNETAWSVDRRGLTRLARESGVHGFSPPTSASAPCELLGFQNGRNHLRTLVRDRDLKQGYTSNTPDPIEPPECVAYWKSIASESRR